MQQVKQVKVPRSSPVSPIPDGVTPSRWRRFACMMYEGVLLFGVVFLGAYLFDTLTQSRSGLMFRHGRQVWLFLVIGLYFVLCWRKGGQTLPMKTWNIKLTEASSDRIPSVGRLIYRYVLAWPIPLAGAYLVHLAAAATGYSSTDLLIVFAPFTLFLWTFIDRDGQFLHDRIAGTYLKSSTR